MGDMGEEVKCGDAKAGRQEGHSTTQTGGWAGGGGTGDGIRCGEIHKRIRRVAAEQKGRRAAGTRGLEDARWTKDTGRGE